MRATSPAAAVLALAAVGLAAAAAEADPRPAVPAHGLATQCLDPIGERHAPRCRTLQTSRIEVEPDICICGSALREVKVPYCAAGEVPAPDSAAANQARLDALKRGDILTARFEGRRFCEILGGSGP